MLSFGLSVVGMFNGERFAKANPGEVTFYRELKPISEEFELEALDVNGLDRASLVKSGDDPRSAMEDAAAWVGEVAGGARPVLVAYPVAFDWSFLYWYFERFSSVGSPFGHSSCLDIRTLYLAVAGTVLDASSKSRMPSALLPRMPHTHNALDDAVEQGELFANLFAWSIRERNSRAHWSREDTPSWLASHMDPFAIRRR